MRKNCEMLFNGKKEWLHIAYAISTSKINYFESFIKMVSTQRSEMEKGGKEVNIWGKVKCEFSWAFL